MRRPGGLVLALLMCSGALPLFVSPASAVPAFARRYGVACSTCHDAWPHLNPTGMSFKMSGYRRLNGADLQPTTKDMELAVGALQIPSIPPLAIRLTTGFDWRRDHRTASDGSRASQTGSSLDLEDVDIFLATPLGKHLSAFLEFPLFETHAEAKDGPTGPAEANNTGIASRRDIQFTTESPAFEMGKLIWNDLLPDAILPTDSFNIEAGVDQLPTPFSAEANRLSVNPYLIYRRRALDLLSPTPVGTLLVGNEGDRLLRLGEPQIQIALMGLVVPFGTLADLAKPETLSIQYNVGLTNGSNLNSDPNTEKDFFGRIAIRWWGQVLGVFGYYSPDIYDDFQRFDGSTAAAPGVGIFSGTRARNSFYGAGPDLTIDLRQFEIPVWIENELLFNRESNPTGFGKRFEWWGGFSQLYLALPKHVVAYARYDWIEGDHFNDTALGGVTGPMSPHEWDAVVGIQWYVLENLRIGPEYLYRKYTNDGGRPVHEKLTEDFFSFRASIAF